MGGRISSLAVIGSRINTKKKNYEEKKEKA